MAQTPRVFNITRGFHLKRSQAERAIENCACVWIEYGVSVRDLTLAESIQVRNEQARVREPLAQAEIPGVTFTGSQRFDLIRQANEFVAQAI